MQRTQTGTCTKVGPSATVIGMLNILEAGRAVRDPLHEGLCVHPVGVDALSSGVANASLLFGHDKAS